MADRAKGVENAEASDSQPLAPLFTTISRMNYTDEILADLLRRDELETMELMLER
jgi:hypothetical protein